MADILIRMEMPESCADCPICYDMMECSVSQSRFWNGRTELEQFDFCNERHPSCPLVELPEHGDLIDRSKLSFVCGGTTPMEMDYVRRYVVDGMPVIVPSNKEETE